jgi:hypothetical protein
MQPPEDLRKHRILSTGELANSDVVPVEGNNSFVASVQSHGPFRYDLQLVSIIGRKTGI